MNRSYRETINRPQASWGLPDFSELWHYRFLLYTLSLREIRIRYKQTVLGFAWSFFIPLLTMLTFTFVFHTLVGVSSDGVAYPVFAAAGIVPWMLFSSGLTYASTSIVSNRELVSKIYFPRILAPIAKQFSGGMDTLVSFGVLLVLMAGYGYFPTYKIIFVPIFFLMTLATALGMGLWLCTIHVRFRDVGPAVPFVVQLWMYITPIGYPTSLVEGDLAVVYRLNPMVTVCDGLRWALLGTDSLRPDYFVVSLITLTILLVGGAVFFQHFEGTFPDLV